MATDIFANVVVSYLGAIRPGEAAFLKPAVLGEFSPVSPGFPFRPFQALGCAPACDDRVVSGCCTQVSNILKT